MQISPRAHSCGGKCKSSRRWALRLHPRRHRPHRSFDPRQTFCQSGGHAKQRRRATTTNFLSGPACKRAHAIYLPRSSCNIVKPPTKRRLSLSRTISPIITRRARSRDLFFPANGRVTYRSQPGSETTNCTRPHPPLPQSFEPTTPPATALRASRAIASTGRGDATTEQKPRAPRPSRTHLRPRQHPHFRQTTQHNTKNATPN